MSESLVALEQAAIEACQDLYLAASPDVVAASGLSVREIGDAGVIAVNRIVNRCLVLDA